MTVFCYPSPGKKKGLMLCEAFAAGCGGKVAPIGHSQLEPGPAFFYGFTPHSLPLMDQCVAEGRDWYYADNAYYFGRHVYFRITKNALMHDGAGRWPPDRFEAFGIDIKPWRDNGRHVLVTTQSELFYRDRLGTTRQAWTDYVVANLRKATDRKIIVCHKPEAQDSGNAAGAVEFELHLIDAWALVAHSSSTMVKALIEGVPVFSLGGSMASVMGRRDIWRIEEPRHPSGREQWLWNLAANQWTREELRDGTCWRMLDEKQG